MSGGYDIEFNNKLETHLELLANSEESQNVFPPCGLNRFDLYKKIKANMNDKFYRDVDGGLTADSDGGAYTRHDLGHVNDVIRKVGQLLGAGSEATTPALNELRPYEVFVLLVACLVHDAGNIDGRMGHEGRAREALREVCGTDLGQKELSLISKVAKAHGGTAQDGSKDTIGALYELDGIEDCRVRPRILAALLRYADELAENNRRANRRVNRNREPRTEAELVSSFPNLFCECISIRVDYQSRRVALDFTLTDTDSGRIGKSEAGEEMYFVDYIKKRVVKAETERRYCDQFLRGFATFSETRVLIEFLHENEEWRDPIDFILTERGYPKDIQNILPKRILDGRKIAKSYANFMSKQGKNDG